MARNAIAWNVTPPGTAEESVLIGSMHLNTEAAYSHIDLILNQIDRFDDVAFEIDLREGKVSQTDFIVNSGMSLADFLTGAQERKARKILLEHFNFPYELALQFYPMFTINVLTHLLLNKGSRQFLDEYLWQYASENDKNLFGLEDVKEHYNVLRTIPMKYQAKAFKGFIFNLTKVRKQYETLSKAYSEQQIHKIFRYSMRSLGIIKESMLYNRNDIIVENMQSFNRENGSCLAIVGAAHLSGKRGILHQLNMRGYEIKPIS